MSCSNDLKTPDATPVAERVDLTLEIEFERHEMTSVAAAWRLPSTASPWALALTERCPVAA